MHASQRLRESHFSVQIESGSASVADLLPEWTITDRVGVVVHEPLGALGASLLIQAAISRFYAFDPQRRDHAAQYPPIFMFHVGGRFGDHSPMDFWPPRREVFFDDPDNPYEVLGALRPAALPGCWCRKGSPPVWTMPMPHPVAGQIFTPPVSKRPPHSSTPPLDV